MYLVMVLFVNLTNLDKMGAVKHIWQGLWHQ